MLKLINKPLLVCQANSSGRVKIVLKDNSSIILAYWKAMKKVSVPNSKLSGLKIKPEAVTGTLHAHTYAWGDGSKATIVGPCLLNIKIIRELQ